MFQNHKERVERAIARSKAVRQDHRAAFAEYHPEEWAPYGRTHDGSLFPVENQSPINN